MSFAIGLGGIVVALVFLTFAVYKGWSILYSSIIGVIIIALTNGMNLYNALTVDYVSSFTSYAANYFILFCEGAMLGKLYDVSGAAWKIGKTVVDKCGTWSTAASPPSSSALSCCPWPSPSSRRRAPPGICGPPSPSCPSSGRN